MTFLQPKQREHSSDIFTDEELCAIWDFISQHLSDREWRRPGLFVGLVLSTGLRRNEARLLRLEDIQLAPYPLIRVRNGKGGKSRTVEVLPEFIPLFRAAIQQLRDTKRGPFVFQSRVLHPSGEPRPMSLRGVQDWWDKVLAAAGIDRAGRDLGIHAGRRAFASYARLLKYNGQAPELSAIQAQLGHSKIDTTAQHYFRQIPGFLFNGRELTWPQHVGRSNGEGSTE